MIQRVSIILKKKIDINIKVYFRGGIKLSKLFKFWKYRFEVKLNKLPNEDKIELLANALVKELNVKLRPECECFDIWIHNKKKLEIDSLNKDFNRIECNYTGK